MKTLLKSIMGLLFPVILICSCNADEISSMRVGAARTEEYVPYLKGKNVGIVANQTTLVNATSLVDTLLALGVDVKKIYGPEHGFRGEASDGAVIENGMDKKTGLPIISIYTDSKKPTPSDLAGIDIMIFDLQDVGLRFYTYISHMHYVMEACAENNIEVMILDRPNPHGFYVDGPVLDTAFRSFVGMHPVPVVHGMTLAEYASMINGERWLKNGIQCKLKLVMCENYTHDSLYKLPVRPSPNLPNMTAVYLYPSICFFEGTAFSLGRGTDFPFQVYGHPSLTGTKFSFTPRSRWESVNPPLLDQLCYGYDLRNYDVGELIAARRISLQWIITAYNSFEDKENFFRPYINKLAGSNTLRDQIISGMSENEIRDTWQKGLEEFKTVRKKYLLYPDFMN